MSETIGQRIEKLKQEQKLAADRRRQEIRSEFLKNLETFKLPFSEELVSALSIRYEQRDVDFSDITPCFEYMDVEFYFHDRDEDCPWMLVASCQGEVFDRHGFNLYRNREPVAPERLDAELLRAIDAAVSKKQKVSKAFKPSPTDWAGRYSMPEVSYRQWLVGIIMASLCSDDFHKRYGENEEIAASAAVRIADAAIAALS